MKHQYFGDISDYRKYNILKTLVNKGNLKTLVCWMLTANDTRSDGNNNLYLKDPNIWRKYDREVFDFLDKKVNEENIKSLIEVEKSGLLPNISYFNSLLEDSMSSRTEYFRDIYSKISDFNLIFLDPDNGIETSSVKKGSKNSSKYIFLDEIKSIWMLGKSLLVYQHFPRVDRITYITRQLERLDALTYAPYLFALKTSYMAYFAVANEKTASAIKDSFIDVQNNWSPQIEAFSYVKEQNLINKL